MKFLKLHNFSLGLFTEAKYGKAPSGSRIPWDELGINKHAVKLKSCQYKNIDTGDEILYVPVHDEAKLISKLSLMLEDANALNLIEPDKEHSATLVNDEFEAWHTECCDHKERARIIQEDKKAEQEKAKEARAQAKEI